MRPSYWQPSAEPSEAEQAIVKRIRRAKLFIFLRQYRHELFDEAFQQELASLYQASELGQPPIPPAQLALATILQAYTGVSDDEVIEATTMDRRWQLVLDCLDCSQPPWSQRDTGGLSQEVDRRADGSTADRAKHRDRQPEPGIWSTSITSRT